MMTSLFCTLALISAVVFKTDGYPQGAPVTVADFSELCDNMTPLHAPPGSPLPVSQPAEDLPYMIIASSNTYAPGKEIQGIRHSYRRVTVVVLDAIMSIMFLQGRGKWGNAKQNFLSVSQGMYIANMAVFMF